MRCYKQGHSKEEISECKYSICNTKQEFLLSELGDGWTALGLNVENALEESLKKGSNTNYSDSEEGI